MPTPGMRRLSSKAFANLRKVADNPRFRFVAAVCLTPGTRV